MTIKLTEYENKILSKWKQKQREVYLMKKYIHWYKTEINISQRDCHQRMNQFLIEQGYKPKKNYTSVFHLWHESFTPYELKS
ncbi:hypothetical protein [Priestia aryabhattai]|uniref:hypothetical protein n=1 Tax=Priestia aryabhattai TaxID=412384 RepID=UPI001C8D294E|nr:hypothetical protein [Priestia aryabhattai]MBY0214124.1 hypothetical protein [Priestia aryabhattai]